MTQPRFLDAEWRMLAMLLFLRTRRVPDRASALGSVAGRVRRLECDVRSLYGDAFAEPLSAQPTTAFVAAGSRVIVLRGQLLA